MTLRDAGVVTQLSDVTESQHQTLNMMGFGERGREVPHEHMQSCIAHDGVNLFMFNTEVDSVVGWDPKDERLDSKHLCATTQDFGEYGSLEDMISSTKWWR
eukprot:8624877-Karenia_brevis.AAC.1